MLMWVKQKWPSSIEEMKKVGEGGVGSSVALPVFAKELLSFGIPKGTAGYEIDYYQKKQSNEKNEISGPPLLPKISK